VLVAVRAPDLGAPVTLWFKISVAA